MIKQGEQESRIMESMKSSTSGSGSSKTEVLERPRRRSFSAEYKLRIVEAASACNGPGEVGALLRREGLYSSHLTEWRKAQRSGHLLGLAPKRRGPAPKRRSEADARIAALEAEVQQWKRRAERAEGLVEVQKKVAELLGRELPVPSEKR
jgi:transposase-like protein